MIEGRPCGGCFLQMCVTSTQAVAKKLNIKETQSYALVGDLS